MKRNEVCYIAVVAVIGVSLLLGFAEEVFGLELGQLAWMAHWVSSPVALALGFAFALIVGEAFPTFNKTMSKKLLQYSVIGLGFGMNVNKALASGSEGMLFMVVSVFGTLALGWFFWQKAAESGFANKLSAEFGHSNMRWLGNSRCGVSY